MLLRNSLMFVLGFSLIFVALGASAIVGLVLLMYGLRALRAVAGVLGEEDE